MSNRTMRLSVALGAAISLLAVLCACTAPDGGSSPEGATSPSGSKSPTAAVESPAATIEPVIVVAAVDVDGEHVTASGYVQGVIEDGGSCSFTFAQKGSPSITVEHEGVADRVTTSCGTVQPDAAQFARGSWSVTLGYRVSGRDYVSAPVELEVP